MTDPAATVDRLCRKQTCCSLSAHSSACNTRTGQTTTQNSTYKRN
jgi:hypothetical protein